MGDGVLSPDDPKPPTGCDYEPCETAVCECDSYCCESAWDLSCRGYYMKAGDTIENNYFVPGCSAKLLCCEQESAFPDPPIGAAMGPLLANAVQVVGPAFVQEMTEYSCEPGSAGCCDTMKPPSYLPPDDSTCWQWWDAPEDGIVLAGEILPKGCDYKPCEAAVCACDPYCCESAWDLSCRGYHLNPEDTVNNNYFVDGCSAKILCCEPESAFPDPPVGGATVIAKESEVITKVIEVEVPQKEVIVKEIPVPVPVTNTVIKEIPVPVPAVKQIPVPVPVPVVKKVPVPVPVKVESACPPCPEATVTEVLQVKSSKSKGKSGKAGPKGSKGTKSSKSKKCGKSGKGKSGKAGSKGSKGSTSATVSTSIEYYEIAPGCTCSRIAQVDCVDDVTSKSKGKSGKAGSKSRRRLGQQ